MLLYHLKLTTEKGGFLNAFIILPHFKGKFNWSHFLIIYMVGM